MLPNDAFLGLPEEDAVSPEKAKAVIVPFGLEASVSYGGGTSEGPQAMIEASYEVELFDDEFWLEPFRQYGVATLKEFKIPKSLPKALEKLDEIVSQLIDNEKFPVVFGGEHSLTSGAIRPFARKYQDLVILHFDAHADLRDGYDGEHYSHAAALRRCLDFEHLKLISCGIRNISSEEIPFLENNKHRINIHWGRDISSWNINDIIEPLKDKHVYVTFDLDGFDASLMPATGTPEPGGLFWNDAMKILKAASKVCTFVGADVNELAPIDGFHSCNFLAAKLAYKIMSYALLK
ncbi:MAG: agmatinase [Alphaproteobacteria bacterium]